jgi:hypothetical protein
MFPWRKEELEKFLNALEDRILSDAPVLIKYLDSRREWDDSVYEVIGCANFEEKEGKVFEIKSYEKSDFTPFLDKRIENLKNKKNKIATIVTGDGDHWSDRPENQNSINIYEDAVKSGCDIRVMLRDLGAWTIKGSAKVLDSIGVSVGRVATNRELHGGVLGGDEMYVIHRSPKEGAQKVIGEAQPIGDVNYTFLHTNFQPYVKQANSYLLPMWDETIPYAQVKAEEDNSVRGREELLRIDNHKLP